MSDLSSPPLSLVPVDPTAAPASADAWLLVFDGLERLQNLSQGPNPGYPEVAGCVLRPNTRCEENDFTNADLAAVVRSLCEVWSSQKCCTAQKVT